MKLKNYTPHPITLIKENGETETLESCGAIRAEQTYAYTGTDAHGVPVKQTKFLDIESLPDREPDTLFIVSQIVAQNARYRGDLVFPGDFVRDKAGKIIGCKSLLKY